ncbi:MAG: DUF433 domain-containing protein [Solirubrobacteraceae bacterium]|nr:DUF433 domain-containing protein [Solirubrobacteraceae bacterium]
MTGTVVRLLDRPTYGLPQVDRLLGLPAGTARRWIDGYERGGRTYEPVVREERTGDPIATWGEFVETRLLAEYRDAGVPMVRMRPAIEQLRKELGVRYPLASARTWLDVHGRELVRQVQDEVELDRKLSLVVVRTGQTVAEWSDQVESFRRSIEWSGDGPQAEPLVIRPVHDIEDVRIDPTRGFGEPVVRGVRTEIIVELVRAGESTATIAELYDLPPAQVEAAVRYELLRNAA